jgi:hypothetical protein
VHNDSDSFDINRLRMTDEVSREIAEKEKQLKQSGKAARTRPIGAGSFVKFPVEAIFMIGAAKNAGTAKLFPLLLHLDWKADHRPFKLPNGALQPLGISRCRKGAVLRELEQLGLIRAEYRSRKSPLITVLTSSKGGPAE